MNQEGDLESNAKLWYKDTDPSVLCSFWASKEEAVEYVDQVSRVKARLGKGKGMGRGCAEDGEEMEVRKRRWDELVCVMMILEKEHGYAEMDGREVYTRDEKPEHKSNILGEFSGEGVGHAWKRLRKLASGGFARRQRSCVLRRRI